MQHGIIADQAHNSQAMLEALYQERAEVEGASAEATNRIETLSLLIKAEEAKVKILDDQMPKAEMAMPMPSTSMPGQDPPIRGGGITG